MRSVVHVGLRIHCALLSLMRKDSSKDRDLGPGLQHIGQQTEHAVGTVFTEIFTEIVCQAHCDFQEPVIADGLMPGNPCFQDVSHTDQLMGFQEIVKLFIRTVQHEIGQQVSVFLLGFFSQRDSI